MADENIYLLQTNPAARKKRLKQLWVPTTKLKRDSHDPYSSKQAEPKAWHVRNGDGKDASHTGPGKGKTENASMNRRRPRMKKRYA